jgi:hypothetical protein
MTPLLFVAIRTDVTDPTRRQLLEIAAARAEPFDASPTDVFTVRIKSTDAGDHPAEPDAVWLVEAMDRLREMGRGCMLAAWNGSETRSFLEEICVRWELLPLELSPQALDLRSLAWALATAGDAKSTSLEDVATALGVESPPNASLLDELRVLGDVYRRVVLRNEEASRLAGLSVEDHTLVTQLLRRFGAVPSPEVDCCLKAPVSSLLERAKETAKQSKDALVQRLRQLAARLLPGGAS